MRPRSTFARSSLSTVRRLSGPVALLILGLGAVVALLKTVFAAKVSVAKNTNPPGSTDVFPFKVYGTKKWGDYGSENSQFVFPWGVAVDSKGNVYVVDSYNDRIQKFDGDGKFLNMWGQRGSDKGQFVRPQGVAVDLQDNVYVVDTKNYRVQKFDSDGKHLMQFGRYGRTKGDFLTAVGVAVDSKGNIYVVESDNHRVQKFDSQGVCLIEWGSYGSDNDQFSSPLAIAVDGADNVYVADFQNGRVQKFDSNGKYLGQVLGGTRPIHAEGVAVDGAGNIYIANSPLQRVEKFNADGNYIDGWGETREERDDLFHYPRSLAVDKEGNIYVADYNRHTIRKIAQSTQLNFQLGDMNYKDVGVSAGTYVISEIKTAGWRLTDLTVNGALVKKGNSVEVTVEERDYLPIEFHNSSAPAVTVKQTMVSNEDSTSVSPIVFSVIFSEPVSGFSNAAVTLSGTAGATTAVVTEVPNSNSQSYNVTVSGMTNSGTVIASIPANSVKDAAGNFNEASSSTNNTVLYVGPNTIAATINPAPHQLHNTSYSPIVFLAQFGEAVTGFSGANVMLSGTAGATTATVVPLGPGDQFFNVAVSGMTNSGTVIATIPAGVAQTASGKLNEASTSTNYPVDYTYVGDTTAPAAIIHKAVDQDITTSKSPIHFTVQFNEAVIGFSDAAVTLRGTAGATTATVTDWGNTNAVYNVAVSGMTNSGTVFVTIDAGVVKDAAGNLNVASTTPTNHIVTYHPPLWTTVNLAPGQNYMSGAVPFNFIVVFSRPVTGFDVSAITMSGTAGPTAAQVTQVAPNDGTTYNVAITSITTSGVVDVMVDAGVVKDAAGNLNEASNSSRVLVP